LFLPKTNNPEKPLYVVEVQFQPDEDLYYRLFGELFLFLRQYKPSHPWRIVVIYPSRTIEIEQTLQFGLSQDAIAQILDLRLEVVQQVATQQNTSKQSPSSN
jgi:predicted transposase/invertase (TIGR01784 family)